MTHDLQSLPEDVTAFYQLALRSLVEARVPFLVEGAFALNRYTGFSRKTKDLDVFVRPEHAEAAWRALEAAGCSIQPFVLHWLCKAYSGDDFVDIIMGLGNGVGQVDDEWFRHATPGDVLGVPVLLAPPEEMIYAKSFVMERERFDGADVAHLIHDAGATLDWQRLLQRYGDHWRVLFGHLVFFGFVYPGRRGTVPDWLLEELSERLLVENARPTERPNLCRGTLISKQQYVYDVEQRGYEDARPPFARDAPLEE